MSTSAAEERFRASVTESTHSCYVRGCGKNTEWETTPAFLCVTCNHKFVFCKQGRDLCGKDTIKVLPPLAQPIKWRNGPSGPALTVFAAGEHACFCSSEAWDVTSACACGHKHPFNASDADVLSDGYKFFNKE